MKILVTYPSEFSEAYEKNTKKIVEHLESLGHSVKQDIEFRASGYNKDAKKLENFQAKLERTIKDSDIVVADITIHDTKIGFDISTALNEKKVVVAIEKVNPERNIIPSIHGNSTRTLIKKEYTDSNIQDVLKKAMTEAKGKLDTKFILIISPEIDRYLDWASQTKRMHKAQIVRSAIENVIQKDKEYKNIT